MPRILSYTPPWLAHGSAGCEMFAPRASSPSASTAMSTSPADHVAPPFKGARHTLAQRGTEVFVAVGNTIRWADLTLLKDAWDVKHANPRLRGSRITDNTEEDPMDSADYKVLKVTVHEPIRQLVPSPNQDLLAIVTSHTVHIAIIPDSSHLDQPDAGPLKVRTYTLGPTVHVLSQSPIVCALWHPLGAAGDCLVTVTEDAVVRLWELNINNRASFDQPTLDLDLAKLHHATSAKENVASHRMGSNRGFSLDRIEMCAAAASFGGTGSDAEHGWSPMTLWVAMTEGDVYALCPLLPTKWRAPTALVPSLTTAVLAKKAYAEGSEAHEEQQRIFTAQLQWLTDVDEQEPVYKIAQDTTGYEWRMPIYRRPTAVSAIPKLQGPFRILPGDVEDDLDLASIHIIPPKLDTEELLAEDDEDLLDMYGHGLSTTVVCLVSAVGRVYITLCLEEIEGQWLPLQKPAGRQRSDPDAQPELILLEALDTLRAREVTEDEWPVITPDLFSRYAFYVTHTHGVFYFSCDPWLQQLEDELQSSEPTGTSFRMKTLTQGASTYRERLLRFEHAAGTQFSSTAAALVLDDSDLGYFLLTAHGTRPQAAVLEHPNGPRPTTPPPANTHPVLEVSSETPPAQLTAPPREPFVPPIAFWEHRSSVSRYLQTHVSARQRATMQSGPLKLDSDSLDVLTNVHREMASDTHVLGTAAASLFRRCERLTAELADQVRRVRDSAARIDTLLGEDADDEDNGAERGSRSKLQARLDAARAKTQDLQARHEQLRRRAAKLGVRPLSDIESAWKAEVGRMATAVDPRGSDSPRAPAKQQQGKAAWRRFDEAQHAAKDLVQQAKELEKDDSAKESPGDEKSGEEDLQESTYLRHSLSSVSSKPLAVPAEVRRGRLAQVMGLLEREAAMVEAARERLARLSTSTPVPSLGSGMMGSPRG